MLQSALPLYFEKKLFFLFIRVETFTCGPGHGGLANKRIENAIIFYPRNQQTESTCDVRLCARWNNAAGASHTMFLFPHIWPWWKSLTAPLTFAPRALWRKLTLKSRSNFCKDVGAETNFSARRPFSKLIHHPGRESRELNMDLSDLISVPFACLPPRAHLRCLWFRESRADFTGGDTRVLSGSSTTF